MHFEHWVFVAGILLLVSVFASKLSTKFGVPALVLFVVIGMLAGSDGPGGIDFSDYRLVHHLGIVALVLILFGGGLDTHWSSIKPVLLPGLSLATIGVVVTAGITGIAAHYTLGLTVLEALLLGAVVSSTDAAAVFGVLRAQQLKLKGSLTSLLELESGGNDPMAVFLTVALTGLVLSPETGVWHLLPELVMSMAIGGVGGVALGYSASWLINRMHLAYDGLYNVFTVGVAFISFAGIDLIGGNGFLSVYICGVVLGSKPFVHRISLIQFHEGMAWLMQIGMFLSLGLLVYPNQLMPYVGTGCILALVLILVARPLAVVASLFYFKGFSKKDYAFISWVGLRGAVPIILSTIPLMHGVAAAPTIFNVVFFIVLLSVVVQGTGLRWVARALNVISSDDGSVNEKKISSSKLEVKILPHSPVIGRSVVELGLSDAVLLVLLTRGADSHIPRGNTILQAGDILLVQTQQGAVEEVRRIFSSSKVESPQS